MVEHYRWERVSPLSVLFFLGQILRTIARNFFQAVVPTAIFLMSTGWATRERLITLGVGLALIVMLFSVLRYLRFRFRVTDDSISIRKGIFRREEVIIHYDRIQGLSTTQNPAYRLFGLVDLKLDTAGSAAAEGHLPAVSHALSDELRRLGAGNGRAEETSLPGSQATGETGQERTLLALTTGDMVRVGLSSNRGLILLAFLAPLLDNLDEQIETRLEQAAEPLAQALERMTALGAVGAAIALFAAAAALLMTLSIAAAFLRYHDFTLTRDGKTVRSRGGLLTTHEHAMRLGKLQVLNVRQGPALRLFNGFRLVAKQAASHTVTAGKSFVIPFATPRFLGAARRLFFDEEGCGLRLEPEHEGFRPISSRYIRSRTWLVGTPLAAFVVLNLAGRGYLLAGLLAGALAFILAWLLARRRYSRWGMLMTSEALVIRRGLIGTTLSAFLWRKVQRVDIVQSPFQRRYGLANMRFVLAAETVTLPWVEERVLRHLGDYVLYRVESSRLAWI